MNIPSIINSGGEACQVGDSKAPTTSAVVGRDGPASQRLGRYAAAVALVFATPGFSEVVDIMWRDTGRFEHKMDVAPGKFAELCGKLAAGQVVAWSFESKDPVDFNIHYHVDKDVKYPARIGSTRQAQGKLDVDATQDYCWMWTNKSSTAVALIVKLQRR